MAKKIGKPKDECENICCFILNLMICAVIAYSTVWLVFDYIDIRHQADNASKLSGRLEYLEHKEDSALVRLSILENKARDKSEDKTTKSSTPVFHVSIDKPCRLDSYGNYYCPQDSRIICNGE